MSDSVHEVIAKGIVAGLDQSDILRDLEEYGVPREQAQATLDRLVNNRVKAFMPDKPEPSIDKRLEAMVAKAVAAAVKGMMTQPAQVTVGIPPSLELKMLEAVRPLVQNQIDVAPAPVPAVTNVVQVPEAPPAIVHNKTTVLPAPVPTIENYNEIIVSPATVELKLELPERKPRRWVLEYGEGKRAVLSEEIL